MAQVGSVVTLTRETLPVFLSIFGDLSAASSYAGSRRTIRRPSHCAFDYLRVHNATDAEMYSAECVDISDTGIGFTCREALRTGETIEVYLPGESQEYFVRVQVVHAQEKDGCYRCGGKFVWD